MLARYTHQGNRTLLTDALGSVLAQADATQTLTTLYGYSVYGETSQVGEDDENSLQYTGRENDETGLYYYRARYYDPELKRFISSDPIGLRGGLNMYVYANANPLRFTDPYGYFGWGDVFKWIAGQGLQQAGKAIAVDPLESGKNHEREELKNMDEERYWKCVEDCRSKNCFNKDDPSTWQQWWEQKSECESGCFKHWDADTRLTYENFPL